MADPKMLFDLHLKDAELHAVLDDFFRTAGRAYVLDDDVGGVVTVHAADVGFDDALHLILPTDFEALEIGEVYHIHHANRTVEQRRM